jgi:hypothetical protein
LVESSEDNKIEVLVTSNNKPNSLIGGMDGTDEGFLINLTEPNAKKVKKSKASLFKKYKALDNSEDSDNKKTKDKKTEDEKTSSNKEDSNYNKGSQTSIKTPVITRRRVVPSTSYYIKRWSETKSWKIILNTELKEQYPTDINELICDAV